MSKAGDSELIRVTVVDYFTGTPLVDRLVWPDAELLHPKTQYSGVTWAQLYHARNTKSCLFGIENARKAVWNLVGPETIVVGHGASNDLRSLRWIHHNIVDSFVLGWIEKTPIREAKAAVVRAEVEKQRAIKAEALKAKKDAEEAAKEQAEKDKAEGKPVVVPRYVTLFSVATAQVPWQIFVSKFPEIYRHRSQFQEILTNICSPPPPVLAPAAKEIPQQKKPPKSKGSGDLSLKTLTLAKLGREIQNAGKEGHCSLEDAIAARDIVHWYITNPSILGEELEKLRIAKLRPTPKSPAEREAEDEKVIEMAMRVAEACLLD